MRFGIITMISDNYGNRLQNYALQQTLKKFNIDVETFHNPFLLNYSERKHKIKKPFKRIIFSLNRRQKARFDREMAFENFNKKYIIWSKFWLNNFKHLQQIDNVYNAVVCGSDQVWNPESNNIDGRYFGTFMPQKKRFSYAASFGLSSVSIRKEEWAQYLQEMNSISVREENGISIVRELAHRECDKHIDPTLLISADEWRTIEQKPVKIDFSKKYILTYFLGEMDEKHKYYIEDIANREHCMVLHLNNIDTFELYSCGPSEFLYLIDHAEYVLTDSFHGTVFSILFKKRFMVFNRNGLENSMYSRIESLLKTFDLYNNDELFVSPDYEKIFCILEKEREKSIKYLRNVINQVN